MALGFALAESKLLQPLKVLKVRLQELSSLSVTQLLDLAPCRSKGSD